MKADKLPEEFNSQTALEEFMSRPRPELIEFVRTISGPLVILGAGGKMGPTLALLARRALDAASNQAPVIAVSRFSKPESQAWFHQHAIETIPCDLTIQSALKSLPDCNNVIYMVGMKFGTSDDPARTWAFNTLPPSYVVERYANARITALSTGNVYPFVPISSTGSVENNSLMPQGEYANSCVARERIFEFCAQRGNTSLATIRLNYALDLRYGVFVDIAQKIFFGQEVDLTMGYFNAIWQGDANEMIIRSLGLADIPVQPFNLTGREILSVRKIAQRLGDLMDRPVHFHGEEAKTALLSNPAKLIAALGEAATPLDSVLQWTANWIMQGRDLLGKPTHFQEREGKY
jgi:nucleoside-diphosphate-sugar epimerase